MGCIITPEWAAGPPASAMIGCEKRSRISSSPGRVCSRIAIWLHIVPLGRNSAASWPSSSATRSWSALTVGSRPRCSSATSAVAIARRIPSLGRVWVSEIRLTSTPAAYEPAGRGGLLPDAGPHGHEVRLVHGVLRMRRLDALLAGHLHDGRPQPLLAEAVVRLDRVPDV